MQPKMMARSVATGRNQATAECAVPKGGAGIQSTNPKVAHFKVEYNRASYRLFVYPPERAQFPNDVTFAVAQIQHDEILKKAKEAHEYEAASMPVPRPNWYFEASEGFTESAGQPDSQFLPKLRLSAVPGNILRIKAGTFGTTFSANPVQALENLKALGLSEDDAKAKLVAAGVKFDEEEEG